MEKPSGEFCCRLSVTFRISAELASASSAEGRFGAGRFFAPPAAFAGVNVRLADVVLSADVDAIEVAASDVDSEEEASEDDDDEEEDVHDDDGDDDVEDDGDEVGLSDFFAEVTFGGGGACGLSFR